MPLALGSLTVIPLFASNFHLHPRPLILPPPQLHPSHHFPYPLSHLRHALPNQSPRRARTAAISLLDITPLKLFLHDPSELGPLSRIRSFLGEALISILASILYQQFTPP
ncbi:MAG: hypothetical protein NTX04_12005, partial [Verrucomicrobia bacterium]|nr:hypothetical protein [Verrucomicrobiota bacterium]